MHVAHVLNAGSRSAMTVTRPSATHQAHAATLSRVPHVPWPTYARGYIRSGLGACSCVANGGTNDTERGNARGTCACINSDSVGNTAGACCHAHQYTDN